MGMQVAQAQPALSSTGCSRVASKPCYTDMSASLGPPAHDPKQGGPRKEGDGGKDSKRKSVTSTGKFQAEIPSQVSLSPAHVPSFFLLQPQL